MVYFFRAALVALLQTSRVLADIDYAVYFDTSVDNRNPRQGAGSSAEYDPKGPAAWGKVDNEAWPIFSDWGEVLDEPGPFLTRGNKKGNECEDRSDSPYDSKHRQSPIMLMEDGFCTDRHKMVNEERGVCAKEEIEFYTSSYGLGATVNCSVKPLLDHSLNDDIWTLQEIVLKTPGEHSIWNYETGEEDTFVGELQLGYKGSRDEFETGLEGHAENIAIVGVMLKVEEDAEDNEELEKLIRGWERHQEEQYEACEVEYDDDECALSGRGRFDDSDNTDTDTTDEDIDLDTDTDTNTDTDLDTAEEDTTTDVEECQEDCSKCCKAKGRKLGSADNMLSAFSTLRGHDNLAETVRKQSEEIKQLKEQLKRCEITPTPAEITTEIASEITPEQHDRDLGYWNRKCGGSYYCLMNLFKNTETDYYYNYRGGLTYPPCTEIVYWRVMMNPLIISKDQVERIERLTYMHLNDDCELDTVGRRRSSSGTCAVDVNRPRQALSRKHSLKKCDSWNTAGAFADFSGEDDDDEDEEEDSNQWSTGGSTWARASSTFVSTPEAADEGTKKKKNSKRSGGRRE